MELLNSSTETLIELDAVPVLHSTPIRGGSSALPPLPQSPPSPLAFNDLSSTTATSVKSCCGSQAVARDVSRLAFNYLSDSVESIQESLLLTKTCCNNRCTEALSSVEREQICWSFNSRSRSDQRQFLFDVVIASAARSDTDGLVIDGYILSGKKLCQKAFLTVLSISVKRLRNVKRLVQSKALSAKPLPVVSRRKTDKVEICSVWMDSYFKRIGDRMPHTEQTHLPSFLTKYSIYHQMTNELSQQGHTQKELSLSHFYAVWKERFSHCVIPKVIRICKIYSDSNKHLLLPAAKSF